jgi:hypothetical protein
MMGLSVRQHMLRTAQAMGLYMRRRGEDWNEKLTRKSGRIGAVLSRGLMSVCAQFRLCGGTKWK